VYRVSDRWLYDDGLNFYSGNDILAAAVASAKTILSKELPASDCTKIWLDQQQFNTIDGFADAVSNARQAYESRSSSGKAFKKARMWLTSLSGRIVYYGNILDVLVQHHPEYVSLAWGAFKFLFVVSLVIESVEIVSLTR